MLLLSTLASLWVVTFCANAAKVLTVSSNGSYTSSSTLYGLMFEDISHSGDGGIYAELLMNRAFQKVVPGTSASLAAWSSVGNATITVVNNTDAVSSALPNSLKVSPGSGKSGLVGAANSGYWGINIVKGTQYNASFYAKSSGSLASAVHVSLVNKDGTTLASAVAVNSGVLSSTWQQYTIQLTPSITPSSLNNTLQVTFDGSTGQDVFFAMFSLFPPTYKNRANGLRVDLAETLASIQPSFFRFPGGNNLEGQSFDTRWKWNETIGPLVDRPGRVGDWTYVNTDGLGLMEYLDLCEDLGLEGFMAVYSGYSLNGESVPADDFEWVWQEGINQIQFVIGDASTNEYAALRAKYGHPERYSITKIEVGNEDQFALETYEDYRWHYLVGNLTKVFPHLEYMATIGHNDGGNAGPTTTASLHPSPSLLDSHIYDTPEWFIESEGYYDPSNWSRGDTTFKVFQGEYAVTSSNDSCLYATVECGRYQYPKLVGSIAEAAYITGIERNSDLVFAASYAPLLQNINNYQWIPNLISFDAGSVIRSTSFYVQQLFSVNRGDTILPVSPVRSPPLYYVASTDSKTGTVFVKAANTGSSPISISFSFNGLKLGSTGTATTLTSSNIYASNTPENPDTVVPVTSSFTAGSTINYTFPANSVVVLAITS